jgi:hypothetical protein
MMQPNFSKAQFDDRLRLLRKQAALLKSWLVTIIYAVMCSLSRDLRFFWLEIQLEIQLEA